MEYFDVIMDAVNYIEDRLHQDITYEDVAKHVGFSVYHFHRIFQMAAKDTMTGYIRERRLTHAACELLHSTRNIMGIALDYHFETHESFSRAFKKMFGVTPSVFRQRQDASETLLRRSQRHRLDEETVRHMMGGITSVPSMAFIDSMRVVGMAAHSNSGVNFSEISRRFQQRTQELSHRTDAQISYGLIAWTGVNEEFEYVSCAQVSACPHIPDGMVEKVIPANHYAVFTHRGPFHMLESSWFYAMGIWLPKSKLHRAKGFAFELYDDVRCGGVPPHQIEVDIYIPVRL